MISWKNKKHISDGQLVDDVGLSGHMIVLGFSQKIYGSLYEPILMMNKSKKASYVLNYDDAMGKRKEHIWMIVKRISI